MESSRSNGRSGAPTLLAGVFLMAALGACGSSTSFRTSTEGSATSGGSGGQGAATSGGGGGQGGATSSGGSKGSGGSTGGKTALAIPPHEPWNHRPSAPSCVFQRGPEPENPQNGSCKTHADCLAYPNGECVNIANTGMGRPLSPYYSCVYVLCASDADCATNEVCDCVSGKAGGCISTGGCRIDADCGGGDYSYCSRGYGWDCGGNHMLGRYYCHTPNDTCINDNDCPGDDYCDYEVVEGWWECKSPNMTCVIG